MEANVLNARSVEPFPTTCFRAPMSTTYLKEEEMTDYKNNLQYEKLGEVRASPLPRA